MSENLTGQNERRSRRRFPVNVPLTLYIGNRTISAYARDVSDRGVYFYLSSTDSEMVGPDFEFMLKLPPEVTLSTWCSIRCQGRLVRKEPTSADLTGIAVEILHYSIVGESPFTA
jgi:PilZ domain